MNESWHKTETDLDAAKHAEDFWSRHRNELKRGEFWADRIKKLKGEPIQRLALALENLPLPASFREAAIATRALIRNKRKQVINYDEELALLYWLAAINSFSIPYSDALQEPGYNVVESMPGKRLKGLLFSYSSLGYQHLSLLNKTDINWLTELWGKPERHTTLHEMHNEVWLEYETKLAGKRKAQEQSLINSIASSMHLENKITSAIKNSKTKNITNSSIIIISIFLIIPILGFLCFG
jgi:hypothetical protein